MIRPDHILALALAQTSWHPVLGSPQDRRAWLENSPSGLFGATSGTPLPTKNFGARLLCRTGAPGVRAMANTRSEITGSGVRIQRSGNGFTTTRPRRIPNAQTGRFNPIGQRSKPHLLGAAASAKAAQGEAPTTPAIAPRLLGAASQYPRFAPPVQAAHNKAHRLMPLPQQQTDAADSNARRRRATDVAGAIAARLVADCHALRANDRPHSFVTHSPVAQPRSGHPYSYNPSSTQRHQRFGDHP